MYVGNVNVTSLLEQLKWDDKLAVASSRALAENIPQIIDKSEFYCFSRDENIHILPITLLIMPKYEFQAEVNAIIRRSLEAGLIEKWQRDSSSYRNYSFEKDDRKIILSVVHIAAALFVLFCGLCLASLTLITECVAFHRTKQADCNRFWIFVAKTVEGRRK